MPKNYLWLDGKRFNAAASRFKQRSVDLDELNILVVAGVLESTNCGEFVREILNKHLPAELLALELFQAGVAVGITLCEQKEEDDRKGQTRSPRVQ